MYQKADIIKGIKSLGIKRTDTLLVHSSMKAIGIVEGGADQVLDAFIEYLTDGLLVFPTHTWRKINDDYNIYDPNNEPSCVGILSNLFLKRPNVYRSLHPTHSVAAIGRKAQEFVSGEEKSTTPCPREGCIGKLYDLNAKILFLGCTLDSNTFIHGVEEWNQVPSRISSRPQKLKIKMPDGSLFDTLQYRHIGSVSNNYGKLLDPFLYYGIARRGYIGNANCVITDARKMADLTTSYLKIKPSLFSDNLAIPTNWYVKKVKAIGNILQ